MANWIGAVLVAIVCLGVSGCAAPQPHYRNATNPSAGDAEFQQDTARCRSENSHATTFVGAYAEVKKTEVDEDKVQACMAARGWRPAGN
jgi:hypothetical protein